MKSKANPTASSMLKKDDLIFIAGAGGFIAGALARYFHDQGFTRIRAIDKKPLPEWYQVTEGVESLCLDLSDDYNCRKACEGAVEVYNLAADMGGMGFIERFRIECLRSILINTHMIEAAYRAGAKRYFFSSSACAYNVELQKDPNVRALKESDAYPAMAERGYGWEKLMSEMFCQEYWAERGLQTAIARFHNVYGPYGTWDGGREKAPAALCRKVIEAKDTGNHEIVIWGDGNQTRSFMYIDDCLQGIGPGLDYRKDRGNQIAATIRPGCTNRRCRAKQRQHFHQAGSGMGTRYTTGRRYEKNVCLDRTAIRRS
jgi:nucleoside-diphosphate-sugar epimerase